MITLHNRELTVTISEQGAELHSIRGTDGYEYLWQADPAVWGWHAPIVFPVCGRWPNDQYVYEGTTYHMKGHGFARFSAFAVEAVSDTAVTFVLRDNEETRAIYPFGFEFRVTYTLDGRSLGITYAARNTEQAPLYMSFGGHEAYRCPEGIEEYDLILPEPHTLDTYPVNPETGCIMDKPQRVFDNSRVLPLAEDWFTVDALIFRHPNLSAVTVRNRRSGRGVTVELGDADNLLVWTKPGAPFLCIEPWWGMGCFDGEEPELTRRQDIHRLESGEVFAATHTLTMRS